jgi:hypothetical protein
MGALLSTLVAPQFAQAQASPTAPRTQTAPAAPSVPRQGDRPLAPADAPPAPSAPDPNSVQGKRLSECIAKRQAGDSSTPPADIRATCLNQIGTSPDP